MKNLTLFKTELTNENERKIIYDIYKRLGSIYNFSICLLERSNQIELPGIPIFDSGQRMEFHGNILALDVEAANVLERMPAENKWYLPITQMFGITEIQQLKSLDEFYEKAENYA